MVVKIAPSSTKKKQQDSNKSGYNCFPQDKFIECILFLLQAAAFLLMKLFVVGRYIEKLLFRSFYSFNKANKSDITNQIQRLLCTDLGSIVSYCLRILMDIANKIQAFWPDLMKSKVLIQTRFLCVAKKMQGIWSKLESMKSYIEANTLGLTNDYILSQLPSLPSLPSIVPPFIEPNTFQDIPCKINDNEFKHLTRSYNIWKERMELYPNSIYIFSCVLSISYITPRTFGDIIIFSDTIISVTVYLIVVGAVMQVILFLFQSVENFVQTPMEI